ncbi:long-chain-fatty-acid--CoA ligase [Halomonas daqingensis]|uniref:Long-chain-fatty-acid--CoA ligase n=1 Tax=Billgrantia desiderata TaxID=52021 RepID=A0ABS9B4Q7_9GAMM|nr:long-chain-fatty-acid--CoA ligase [Halomonas desiderata]MCE8042372.1 long-chain-fatty-acid--CoA ligase [Halomonas desiderata]MCE8046947.1 long-chain-fatty-acid--CoA ligase [Halomonas desiderata]
MLTGDMLRRAAERFPNKPAILWQGTELKYRELDRAANRLANTLIDFGLEKGAKVGILSRNRTEYGTVFFGSARAGTVLVNVSVLYAPEELTYVLDKADVELLFYEDVLAEKVDAVRDHLPKLKQVVRLGEEGNDPLFSSFIAKGSEDYPKVEIDEDDPFCMTYTGGTTGRPKGVLCSHRNRDITAHTVMVEEALDERDVIGIVTPLFHVAALNIMFQPAVLAGATCTFLSQWSVPDFASMVRETKMTAAFMVPTQVSMIMKDPEFDAAPYESWRKLSFAGAPMPDWVQQAMLKQLPKVEMVQIYGQSEMGVLTALRPWYLPEKLGAIGRQAYNVDLALLDSDGNPVGPGEVGEIASRGDNVMLEYYKDPDQTAAFWRNGWALTGDLGVMDEDGFVTLVDRAKDMIISGGENIYPKEIENAIYEHPAVAECAVFGIPDDKWGEVPAAYVSVKPGAEVNEEELVELCARRLARFKRPRLVKFVDSFPKTPIGKIQKNVLRENYWKDREKKI